MSPTDALTHWSSIVQPLGSVRATALSQSFPTANTSELPPLVVKLALLATVLLLAAANSVSIVPRMSRRAASMSARLAACGDLVSAVRIELLLAGVLVAVAAVLAGLIGAAWLAFRRDHAKLGRIESVLAGNPVGPTRIWQDRDGAVLNENDGGLR